MGQLSDKERIDWLRLIRTDTIGPITFNRLISRFGSATAALDALPELSKSSGRKRPLIAAPLSLATEELELAEQISARPLASCEDDYPSILKAIPDAPPVIYVKGHISLFSKPSIAIVGARNASAAGRKFARDLSAGLGAEDIVVTSGLARGIDGAAHEAALATGTIAVVAGGIDVIYPPEHDGLIKEVCSRGMVVSERPPGTQPTARDFPRRNRLISGLSRGVVVVEAAAKSGTLITARFALEQGREVFAVPGSPLDPRCQGANGLIRDGATLIQSAADIIDVLAAQTRGIAEDEQTLFNWSAPNKLDDGKHHEESAHVAALVLEALSHTPLHRDDIIREIEAPVSQILDALVMYVLSGHAIEHSGGRFTLSEIE